MRTSAGVLSLLFLLAASCQSTSPGSLLDRGKTAFRSGDYSSAVIDLQAAAQRFMPLENLDKLEEALVYLALSQARLGREGDARETILRLISAEQISPTYERLQIAEAKELEVLVASLLPGTTLPLSTQVALSPVIPAPVEDETTALPAVAPAAPVQVEEKVITQPPAAQISEVAKAVRSAYVTSLRQAEALADKGDLEAANAIYQRIATTGAVPRDVIAVAAVGLYRTGAFRDSAAAFKRLGTFAKGEEDLRYYNAVALYESGSYQEAKKELACALPFIHVTEDVSRYRLKIEQAMK